MNTRIARAGTTASEAFTLVELLVVIAAVAILVALLLPGLARGNQQAEGGQCLSSLQQLSEAWLMYNSDNRGNFPPNGSEGAQGVDSPTSPDLRPGGIYAQWCPGRQDVGGGPGYLTPLNAASNAPNVGQQWIKAGLIYPYVKNVQDYLCPADESFDTFFGVQYPHVRSKSMNAWLSPLGSSWDGGSEDANLRVYGKETDLTVPGPANTWLLADENPQSINDAWMVEDPTDPRIENLAWVDCPASYHNGACGISFCDGHAGLKKWRDSTVLDQTQMNVGPGSTWSSPAQSNYLPDILWMVNRSTALKSTTSFLGPQGW